jgi:hypothetical protein
MFLTLVKELLGWPLCLFQYLRFFSSFLGQIWASLAIQQRSEKLNNVVRFDTSGFVHKIIAEFIKPKFVFCNTVTQLKSPLFVHLNTFFVSIS